MTMLSVVQDFCEQNNLPSPTTVLGTSDKQVAQIKGLLQAEGNDLSRRGAWEGLLNEAAHTTLNQEDQGAMTTIAPNGFNYIVNQTIWDRTDILPVLGPMDSREWQALKAVTLVGPRYRFRIRGGRLITNPIPAAGHDWRFEYVSKNWIKNGITFKDRFTLDTDEILLPYTVVLSGLTWRWLKKKGLDYAEEFRTYEMQKKDALGRDGGKEVLHADDSYGIKSAMPGIFVPDRGWTL
jgi:hypothetical protein